MSEATSPSSESTYLDRLASFVHQVTPVTLSMHDRAYGIADALLRAGLVKMPDGFVGERGKPEFYDAWHAQDAWPIP